jgi:hypothetical protein
MHVRRVKTSYVNETGMYSEQVFNEQTDGFDARWQKAIKMVK